MVEINKLKPVLVTGATGYVAGWIIKQLLEEGIIVHAIQIPFGPEKHPPKRNSLHIQDSRLHLSHPLNYDVFCVSLLKKGKRMQRQFLPAASIHQEIASCPQ